MNNICKKKGKKYYPNIKKKTILDMQEHDKDDDPETPTFTSLHHKLNANQPD